MRRHFYLFFALCIFTIQNAGAQNVPSYVPTSGLAAWYPFSGNAVDSSNNGNDAVVYGPTLTTDRFGRPASAYRFNGSTDYMKVNTAATSTLAIRNSSYTIAVWFKADWQTTNQNMQFMYRGDPTPAFDPYCMYLSNGSFIFRRDVASGNTSNIISYNLSGNDTGIFHQLAGSYDSASGKMTVYMDGTLVSQMVIPGMVNYSTAACVNFIGAMESGQNFKGVIDEIGVWTRALDRCEISRLYYASALITQQPVNDTVAIGRVAQFSITDVGTYASYQWQVDTGTGFVNLMNSTPYSGVNTRNLIISPTMLTMDGYHFRCLRNGGNCFDNSAAGTLWVVHPANTGVSVAGSKVEIGLYPNPNSGVFILRATGSIGGTTGFVEISDAAGRVIRHQACDLSSGKVTLDYRNLSSGIYFLKLRCGDTQRILRFSKIE